MLYTPLSILSAPCTGRYSPTRYPFPVMPLSLTLTGSRHAIDVVICQRLPEGQQVILMPLPGAPPYRCPTPCGGVCPHMGAASPPPPLPDELRLALHLAPTLLGLVTAALGETEPAGTAEDAAGPMAWGCLRYYRN